MAHLHGARDCSGLGGAGVGRVGVGVAAIVVSDCTCIGGYDGAEASIYRSVTLKARKPHKCCECKRTIQDKDNYERVTGLWDGSWSTYRFCAACSEISQRLSCDGRLFGSLWDDIQEYLFPEMGGDCFDKLETAHAKQFLRDRWMEWKGLAEPQR